MLKLPAVLTQSPVFSSTFLSVKNENRWGSQARTIILYSTRNEHSRRVTKPYMSKI